MGALLGGGWGPGTLLGGGWGPGTLLRGGGGGGTLLGGGPARWGVGTLLASLQLSFHLLFLGSLVSQLPRFCMSHASLNPLP